MKVAIIGATGQFGSDLVKVFGESAIPLSHDNIEVRNLSSCVDVLRRLNPDVVINCAAYVRVDDAEDESEKAFAVNAVGARNVALACERINATNVYISTDYVFDGIKDKPYVEDDTPNPISAYGLSKYAGEIFTKNYSSKYYIIRVSSLYGAKGARGKGGNFVESMIKKANNGDEIKVVDDMVMSPTYTKDAANLLYRILELKLPYGIYHCSNQGYCSWYEFARTIFNLLNLEIDITPVKTSKLKLKAKRPLYSAMESEILPKYNLNPNPWKTGLKRYLVEKGYL